MHFIAMLGFTIPDQSIRYNVPVTILSMVLAVVVVGIGTFIVGFKEGTGPLLLGGVIIGCGVATLPYAGMSALPGQAPPAPNPPLFAGPGVHAVVHGTPALVAG